MVYIYVYIIYAITKDLPTNLCGVPTCAWATLKMIHGGEFNVVASGLMQS